MSQSLCSVFAVYGPVAFLFIYFVSVLYETLKNFFFLVLGFELFAMIILVTTTIFFLLTGGSGSRTHYSGLLGQ